MLKQSFWRLAAALGAAAYWGAIAWLCLAVAGQDPIDAASAAGTAGARVATLAVLAVAVVVFALGARAWSRLGGQERSRG